MARTGIVTWVLSHNPTLPHSYRLHSGPTQRLLKADIIVFILQTGALETGIFNIS